MALILFGGVMTRKNGIPTWINLYYVLVMKERGIVRSLQEYTATYKAVILMIEDMDEDEIEAVGKIIMKSKEPIDRFR
ncbi:hypothetical protein [Butyrivibrio sp. WCD3002]|uniref:hypothetical protein n=1 Tax=Butyrivibrio sp. WCD3002 TaxID=1280676 RepID=UPI00047A03EC|nr:hypothetical protein [Butyrivibrio sp. WCD3002]